MQYCCVNERRGFTLLEVLLAVTVCAVIGVLGLMAGRGIYQRAQQVRCASNLRQIGVAIQGYAQDHQGQFPLTTHTVDASSAELAWIYSLAEYLADVDDVRICPADPKGEDRLRDKGSSYLLNSYLTVPQVDPFGRSLGGYTNANLLPSPETTALAFPINFARGTGGGNDHTHSDAWRNWDAVRRDIQPDCFGGGNADGQKGSANYLFADGHVEAIQAETLHGWVGAGYNFADPTATRPGGVQP